MIRDRSHADREEDPSYGRRWQVIDAGMINDCLREISGRRMTA
ncbi:hypothetical protein EV385_5966 [Krasilnikovia cinnamomea]|uniref:Uncharacterized protein n=1 Tax=Krasilnikovia cinnamomea TaxID=349313 RepID=A0A4Q7ZTZ5_9ACTN|nr:hypothetical protein [Krasilnikovia cinnamomea]RZU54029.1 hypothetical protein EV385_5966 [Krasilnikovia cinnamomea]